MRLGYKNDLFDKQLRDVSVVVVGGRWNIEEEQILVANFLITNPRQHFYVRFNLKTRV